MVTKKTVEAEVNNTETTFEYKNGSFTVPPARKWPLEAIEAQEEGKITGFLKGLLGADQYAALRKEARTLEDLDEFVGVLFASLDVDKGK